MDHPGLGPGRRRRLYGWIPVELELDIRTDGAGLAAVQGLTTNQQAALAVPGYRPSAAASASPSWPAAPSPAGTCACAPPRRPRRPPRVYRESVRAGLADLVFSAATGATPGRLPHADAWTSLATALAAQESAATGTAIRPAPFPM